MPNQGPSLPQVDVKLNNVDKLFGKSLGALTHPPALPVHTWHVNPQPDSLAGTRVGTLF